jgi:hypothetical protein
MVAKKDTSERKVRRFVLNCNCEDYKGAATGRPQGQLDWLRLVLRNLADLIRCSTQNGPIESLERRDPSLIACRNDCFLNRTPTGRR